MKKWKFMTGIAVALLAFSSWGADPVASRAAEAKPAAQANPAAAAAPVATAAPAVQAKAPAATAAPAAQAKVAAPAVPVAPAAPVAQAKPSAQQAPAEIPLVPPDYRYLPAGKPDPFRPFPEVELAEKKKKEEEQKRKAAAIGRPLSPLQQADLAKFRLLGIAGNDNRRTAIVADGTAKKFYSIFVGTYIGLNEGRVAAILPDRLVVEERVAAQGKWSKQAQVKQIAVLLHKEQ